MNNNNSYGEMGSFCKSLKIEKTIAYTFNNVLLNWSITKEGLRGPCLPRWYLLCIILECFVNFLDYPYYEPLPWFHNVKIGNLNRDHKKYLNKIKILVTCKFYYI